MFDIDIQINTSEKNKISKSIENIITLSGTLKDKSSVVNPTIIIEGDMSALNNANYMTINAFNRSYFITDITAIRNNIIEIKGHVDVLSSFAESIKENSAIIRRNENEWNLYLNDNVFKVYQNPTIITTPFPSGFSTLEYVLSVLSG